MISGSTLLMFLLTTGIPYAMRLIAERRTGSIEELTALYRGWIEQNRTEREKLLSEFDADPAVADLVAQRKPPTET